MSAPGQKKFASLLAVEFTKGEYWDNSLSEASNIGSGEENSLPFISKTLLTAKSLFTHEASPYTVSVGMQTTPPSNKISTASARDSSLTDNTCGMDLIPLILLNRV